MEHPEKEILYHSRQPTANKSKIPENALLCFSPLASIELVEALGMSSERDPKNREGSGWTIFGKDSKRIDLYNSPHGLIP